VKLGLIVDDIDLAAQLRAAVRRCDDAQLMWHRDRPPRPAEVAAVDAVVIDAAFAQTDVVSGWRSTGARVAVLARGVRTNPKSSAMVYGAMQAGADHVFDLDSADWGPERLLNRLRWLIKDRRSEPGEPDSVVRPDPPKVARVRPLQILALGASAGGPRALSELMRSLPKSLPVAILVVVHLEAGFDAELCELLSHCTAMPVGLIEDGERPVAGRVHLCPAGRHLLLDPGGRMALIRKTAGDAYCPAIDRLFESLAKGPFSGAAALLTGMGADGAQGLLALRQAGWYTLAQDALTSAVYGMPRKAFELGAAIEVLPLPQIGAALTRVLTGEGTQSLNGRTERLA
jgi:two-component system response regulator WspF